MTVIRRTAAAPARRRRTLLGLVLLFAASFAIPLLFSYLWPRTEPKPPAPPAKAARAAHSEPAAPQIAVPPPAPNQNGSRGDADAAAAADPRTQPETRSAKRGIVTRVSDAIARWWLAIRAYILVAAAALIAGLIVSGLLEKPQRLPVIPPPVPRPVQGLSHGVARFVSPSLFVKEGVWKAVAASVAGTSHARTKQPCQDASYCRVVGGNTLIGAVADGAGSARLGGEGAQVAARAAVEAIVAGLAGLDRSATSEQWVHVLRGAMGMARVQVEISSALLGAPPRDLACTLLLFVARPGLVVASQIGDGAVVVRDAGGEFHSLTTPQNGEYANTTTFLVSPDALKTVQHQAWEKAFTGLAAFTDGLQRLALVMPVGSPHVKFFAPLFGFADKAADADTATQALDEFLRSSKVTERADDDLTILLARLAS